MCFHRATYTVFRGTDTEGAEPMQSCRGFRAAGAGSDCPPKITRWTAYLSNTDKLRIEFTSGYGSRTYS